MSANEIVFDAQYASEQVKTLDRATELVNEAVDFLKKASLHEGWKCRECNIINDKVNTITTRLGKLDQGMNATAEALARGRDRFSELEERAATQADGMANDLKGKYGFEASTYGQDENTNLPVTRIPYDKNSLAIAKTGLSWLDKAKISDRAGLGKDVISYFESLYKFSTGDKRGLAGAEDLFDLGDKSVGAWTGLYDYFKEHNQAEGIFSIANQKKVKGLDILGSSFGLVSSAFGVADKISSGKLGTAGTIGEVLGAGSDVIGVWGSFEKFKHMADTGKNITSPIGKTGLYSPLSLWSAFGDTVVSTGSQAFKSIEKYSADGKWDLGDTGRTGVETGVSGLYTMFDKLSFGGLSALGNATGFTPENISRDIENWADGVGKRAGRYIVNDPGLHEAYNNAGPIGKTAITFHAAFQSGIQSAVEGIGNWFQSLWS